MKKLFIILVFSLLFSFCDAANWDTIYSHCVAHWKMNDNADSNTVIDSKGSYNGTATRNTEDMHVDGKVGGALNFNGESDYIDTNSTFSDVFNSDFSISTWIKASDGMKDNLQSIFNVYQSSNEWFICYIETPDEPGNLRYEYCLNGLILQGDDVFVDGVNDWKLITVVMIIKEGAVKASLYVNSQLVDEETKDISIAILNEHPIIGNYFEGRIDDFMIFDKALTADEVGVLYRHGLGTKYILIGK